ncbi:MAG: site-specific integrase [Sulfurimonas sp.]|nr:site-specific integrase [Sulfurimonas sp.]
MWITFYYQSTRYRRTLNLDDTKANRKLATTKILPEIIHKLNSGAFFEKEKNTIPTVDEYAKVSLSLHSKSRKATTTYDYETSIRLHISPTFGKKRLDKIKPSDIQLWQNKLLDTLKPRRVRNVRATFNTIFDDAIRDEIIDKNPISKVKVPKLDKVEVKSFALDEVKLIIETAKDDMKAFTALGFFSGMRSGELIGLRWSDIDFEKKEIFIQRAIRMGTISTPKTKNSIRVIDILDNLLPYLKEQYERTGSKDSYVFLNEKDEHYYDIKRIRNTKWKNLLKECSIEFRTIYQMRHTFATIMIENNEDILWVSNMLGHSDASMTLQMYAKYRKREDIKRASFLGNI